MNKIFILLLHVSIQLYAQQYKPLLDSVNVWCFTGNIPPVNIPDAFYTGSCNYQNLDQFAHSVYSSHDTIIDSISYKVLESVNIQSNFCRYGYIREDTSARKVYFRDNILSPEVLLYDFSMQVGDVIYLDFPTSGGNPYYPSDFYIVDSIVNTVLAGGSTNAYYLSCGTCLHILEWIEGVGNRGSLAYTFTQNNTSGGAVFNSCYVSAYDWQYNYNQILTSFEHSIKVYFDSCAFQFMLANPIDFDYIDSCLFDYIGSGIDESLNQAKLFPNPSKEKINILSKTFCGPATIEILNLESNKLHSEKILLSTEIPCTIDISFLEPGIYITRLELNNHSITKKLIVTDIK